MVRGGRRWDSSRASCGGRKRRRCFSLWHRPIFRMGPFIALEGVPSGEGIFTIVRPPATFGHADYFANWLVMVVFLALELWRIEESRRWRTIAGCCLVLAVLAIILSGTRSALLGLGAGAVVYAAIARPRLHRKGLLIYRRRRGLSGDTVHFSGRRKAARARSLVSRRRSRRGTVAPVAGLAAHGDRPAFARLRAGNVHLPIPAFRIGGIIASVSGFLSGVASQHVSRRAELARPAGRRLLAGALCARAVVRAKKRRACRCALRGHCLPAIHGADDSHRALFLSAHRDERRRSHAAALRRAPAIFARCLLP